MVQDSRKKIKKISSKYLSLPVQVRASLWFLICSFLQKGISMITTPIFTRIMSTSDYGQFGVFNSWYAIVTNIVSLNLYYGVHSQGIVKYSEDRSRFTSSLLGLTTTLVSVWTIIYMLFHDFWNRTFTLTTIQMLSMLLIIWTSAVFSFWANEQRVTYSYRQLIIITLLTSVLKPLVEIILILYSDDKVTARILGWVIIDLMAYTWMYVIQMKRGKVFFSKVYWKYALIFNIPLVPHYLSQTVLSSADRIMIQNMVGSSEAGIYNLTYSVSMIMILFNSALSQTISPWMYQKIKEKKVKEIAPIAYITFILIAIVNLLLILLAPEIIIFFAPKTYYEAVNIIPPIAMSVFFMYTYDFFAKFAFYYEKTTQIMLASVIGAALNIGMNYFFINLYGYMAAGYTTLLCYIVFTFAHYYFMRKICRDYCGGIYPYETYKILIITILFLITGFSFLFTYQYPIIRYGIVLVFVLIGIYFRKEIIKIVKDLMNLREKKI